jgi:type I restriction enzyme S subunit
VKPGDHYSGGVPVVKVENITNGEVQTGDLLHTDPEIHQKYDRAELKQGDLLFTIRGTVGRMAFVPASLEGGNLTQDTARIRVENANPDFVRYYLETATPHNYFERHTKGQAVQGINLEDLQQVPVHLPSREEQKRIVEIIDSHTEQVQKEREYNDHLKRLKHGLMQDLLSGTVRTTDTNIQVPEEIAQYG